MPNKDYSIKSNEKGYDEMLYFLGQSGFKLKIERERTYWINKIQKIESISKENILKLIIADDDIKKSLEYIAEQEKIRN